MQTIDLAQGYQRPDLDRFADETAELARDCAHARTDEAVTDCVARWNVQRESLQTARRIAGVRYAQDTRNEAARADHASFTEAAARLRELDVLHARTLTTHPRRDAIDRAYGPQLLRLLACGATGFTPAIRDALAEEAELVAKYTALTARAAIRFDGTVMNEGGLARGLVAADRTRRLEAQIARDRWLGGIGDEVDAIYDRLVHLRDAMGRALGHDGFTPLGYALLGRTEYGPDEVARFRDEIVREIVPLAAGVFTARAKRLGIDRVRYHDEAVADRAGNPVPLGDAAFCLEQARRAFDAMGDAPRGFVEALYARGMFDLENRDGKAAGAFCANFVSMGTPFVFANLAGTSSDVTTLMHECGHAMQAHLSRAQPLLEYRFPTYEACEVHSMGLEFLAWPWMDLFFGDEGARRYRTLHLEERVLAMPYLVLIDHFQHDVYARPDLSPRARRQRFRALEKRYLPWRDYGAAGTLPAMEDGALWHRQLHLFVHPFYYVDYALAQTCALQLLDRAHNDHPAALRDFLGICHVGGSLGFEPMIRAARLRSPLQPGVVTDVARSLRSMLAR